MFVILEIVRHYFKIILLLWKILNAKDTSLRTTTSVRVLYFFSRGVLLVFLSKSLFFHQNTASSAFLGLLPSDPLLLSVTVTVTVTMCDPGQPPWEERVAVGTNKHSRIKAPPLFWKSWSFAPSEVLLSSPAVFSCGSSRTLWLQLLCCWYFPGSSPLKHDQHSTATSPWQYPQVNCSFTTPLMSQQHQSFSLRTWNCSLSTSCLYYHRMLLGTYTYRLWHIFLFTWVSPYILRVGKVYHWKHWVVLFFSFPGNLSIRTI